MNSEFQTSPQPLRPHLGGPRASRKQTLKVNTKSLYQRAVKEAFVKLNPKVMVKNPVMFVVWVGTIITALMTIDPNLFGSVPGKDLRFFNFLITLILFFTVVFANFAEAVAEGRGKAQADALRATKSDTIAQKLLPNGSIQQVSSTALRRGDQVKVIAGDIIPSDGEVVFGVASVDESAITGESAPVLKEPGSDVASSVTGGTRIISDELIIRVTSDPGQGFIDRMIALVEGAERTKTPNEIALTVLLAVLTLVFLFVVATTNRNTRVNTASNTVRAISFGVFVRSAPSTKAIIRSINPWPGSDVTRIMSSSEMMRVPPVTELATSDPGSFSTGADSPVIADSSTLATPKTTSPSDGMMSPAITFT